MVSSFGGWPKTGGGSPLRSGPAIADLDGAGTPEVVVGSDDGRVYAWHGDGSVVAGFPADVSVGSRTVGVAVSRDVPARIAATTENRRVAWIDASGGLLPGWPVTLIGILSAPVIATIQGAEALVVAEGASLHAFDVAGSERPGFPVDMAAVLPARSEVAIGDVDQNGVEDLVLAMASPARLEVRDSTGASLAGFGWPRAMPSAATGAPVLGHLTGGGAPEIMALLASGLTGFSNVADSLLGFPKPGGGGTFPTLADLDGDGTTEVLAGSTLDPLLFVYDAGPSSAAPSAQPWPTFRGNFSRTGSARGRALPVTLDLIAPGAVNDLTAEVTGVTSVRLRWTATGDDVGSGAAHEYDVRRSPLPIDAANFASGTAIPAGAPSPAGARDSIDVTGLIEGFTYYFALRAIDEQGKRVPSPTWPARRCSRRPRRWSPICG